MLDLTRMCDCEVLWEVAKHVAWSDSDFFLSDTDCKAVYILHHHHKIMISIPDSATRQELSHDLTAQDDIFQDCSLY